MTPRVRGFYAIYAGLAWQQRSCDPWLAARAGRGVQALAGMTVLRGYLAGATILAAAQIVHPAIAR